MAFPNVVAVGVAREDIRAKRYVVKIFVSQKPKDAAGRAGESIPAVLTLHPVQGSSRLIKVPTRVEEIGEIQLDI